MITVQVRDEYPYDSSKVETLETKLALSSLPTVHKEELLPKLYYLGSGVVYSRR